MMYPFDSTYLVLLFWNIVCMRPFFKKLWKVRYWRLLLLLDVKKIQNDSTEYVSSLLLGFLFG